MFFIQYDYECNYHNLLITALISLIIAILELDFYINEMMRPKVI